MAQTLLVREMFEGLGTLDTNNLGSFSAFQEGSMSKAAVGPRLSTTAHPGWSAALPNSTNVRARFDLTAGVGLPAKNLGMVGAWFRFSSNDSGFDASNVCRLLGLNHTNFTSYVQSLNINKAYTLSTSSGQAAFSTFRLVPNKWYYLALAWNYNTGSTQYTIRVLYRTVEMQSLSTIGTSIAFGSGGAPFAAAVENVNGGGSAKYNGRVGGVGLYSLGALDDSTYDTSILPPVDQPSIWYINPSTGSDSNTGISPSSAWQTATKIASAQTDGIIMSAEDYKSGDKLIIDTSAANLTLSTELTFSIKGLNVMSPNGGWITVQPYKTLSAGGFSVVGNGVYSTADTTALCCVWENNKWMTHSPGANFAAAQALLESTPGSFWTDGTTLYIHPFGNTDPRNDGKTYTRSFVGLTTPAVKVGGVNQYIRDLYITKTCDVNATTSAPNLGYCLGDVTGFGGTAIIEHCYLAYGGKHCHGWTVDVDNTDVSFIDIQAEQGSIWGGAGAQTPFVSFMSGATKTGNIHRYIRCKCSKNYGVVGSTEGASLTTASTAYSHNSGSGNQFREIQYIDCSFSKGLLAGGGTLVSLVTVLNTKAGHISVQGNTATNVLGCIIDLRGFEATASLGPFTVRHCQVAPTADFLGGQFTGCQCRGTMIMENNIFDLSGIANTDIATRGILQRSAALTLTARYNTLVVPASKQYTFLADAVNTDTLVLTDNKYILGAGTAVLRQYNDGSTTAERTLAQSQALGFDARSTAGKPGNSSYSLSNLYGRPGFDF